MNDPHHRMARVIIRDIYVDGVKLPSGGGGGGGSIPPGCIGVPIAIAFWGFILWLGWTLFLSH